MLKLLAQLETLVRQSQQGTTQTNRKILLELLTAIGTARGDFLLMGNYVTGENDAH